MPNTNHVEKPLVRHIEQQAAALEGDEGKRLEDKGVTRAELDELLAKHKAEMQSIVSLFEMFKNNDPRRESPVSANVLEAEHQAEQRTLEALRTAPKVPVYIVPMPYEAQAIEAAGGEPLYRMVIINGIQYPVKVGEVANVPEPIAEIIHNGQELKSGKWRKAAIGPPTLFNESQSAQDLETIPRPPRVPWAEEMGRSGVVSTDVFRPFHT